MKLKQWKKKLGFKTWRLYLNCEESKNLDDPYASVDDEGANEYFWHLHTPESDGGSEMTLEEAQVAAEKALKKSLKKALAALTHKAPGE